MTALRLPAPRHLLAAAALALAAGASQAGGLDLHADADAADVGLPAYPGAIKKAEKGGDPSGFKFGIWGESFGVKIAVVSYRSVDSVDKVAAFYRDALAKYGTVLDCTGNVKKPDAAGRSDDEKKVAKDKPVTCGDDTVAAGGRLFKVGTGRAQRVFKVSPWHDGASFDLIQVEEHGTD
jgi:hypothetical protein